MYLNILKKDLKRKKTMNVILLLFIILAVMFVSSGLNNVFTVMNGTDYYLDKARVGDFVIIAMNDDSTSNTSSVLDKAECVKNYKTEKIILGSNGNVKRTDDTDVETKNNPVFQSISDSKLTFFDVNNEPITEVKQGEVMIAGKFMENNDFAVGDNIRIKLGDTQADFKIAGKAKDAFLGSDFMGNTRFLFNQADYDKFLSDENADTFSHGEITYIETDDTTALTSVISDIQGVAFNGARSTLKLCYVMDMIVAFIVLILSICLMIVSFVVLRFSIGFTITEEYREIGVMKAIGLKNHKIRGLYIVKYLILSVIGGVVGIFASIPFGNMLLKSVSENMVLGNDSSMITNILSTIGTMALILLFAYNCTGKVKKLTPLDAIRSGQKGERFSKKSFFRIGKTKAKPAFYMAVNDILSSPKRFMTVIISFFICTLFVLILVNTVATMKSPSLMNLFGTKSDIYISGIIGEFTSNENEVRENLKEITDKITAEGMPCEVGIDIQYKYKITSKGNDYSFNCSQSINIPAEEYEYYEGTAPQNRNEIAVTPQVSEKLDAEIGDTVTIDFGTEKIDCIITAYFQSMNQLGEIVRLSDEAPTDMKFVSVLRNYQVDFTDNPSEKEIENRKERIENLFDNAEAMNATEYCIDCLSAVPMMEAVQYLLLAITVIVVVLVTILVERSFISDEHSQIAILKAIGFGNGTIIKWHTLRFGISALVSAVLAGIASVPMTSLCITPIFRMMGASDVNFNINPLLVFLVYPAVIFAVTIITACITSLYTRTIKTSEATNIE
ncbi:MAG: ABC transporter permease [Ruminococcus flavefaciens]|nr:ABC transporter permease [Ruminococcus flavefaciens]